MDWKVGDKVRVKPSSKIPVLTANINRDAIKQFENEKGEIIEITEEYIRISLESSMQTVSSKEIMDNVFQKIEITPKHLFEIE